MKRFNASSLAEIQIHLLIKKGKFVTECKKEWKRRYAMDYPLRKNTKGEVIDGR